MYLNCSNLFESLRQLDPQDNYIGTEFEGLDAFERQLKRFTITTSDVIRAERNNESLITTENRKAE